MRKGKRGQASSSSGGPISHSLSVLFEISFFVLVIVVIVVAGIIVFQRYQSGQGATAVAHVGVAAENTGAQKYAKYLPSVLADALFNTNEVYGFESEIDKSQIQEVGIKDIRLQQLGRSEYDQPIEVLGRFLASSPLQDLSLTVDCQLEEGEKVPASVSATFAQGNVATIPKGTSEVITASCRFPQGISAKDSTFIANQAPSFSNPVPTTQEVPLQIPGKVNMFIRYEFASKASHKTYLLSKTTAAQLQRRDPPVSAFDYYGVSDPQLNRQEWKIKSVATPGPLNLGIGTYASQPFVEEVPHPFAVSLSNNLVGWNGQLKKLESLDVLVPPYMRLETDADYAATQTTSTCPFVYSGEGSEGFRQYVLKDEVLARVNQECDKETLQSSKLTQSECEDLFSKEQDKLFACNFKYSEPFNSLKYDFIRAETKYLYETKEALVVTAYRPIGVQSSSRVA